MKILRWRIPSPMLLAGVMALPILFAPVPSLTVPQVRRISLDARQFEYAPGRIEVNQGDRVVITLTASDVVHGFYLDGYGIERRLEPGIAQQVEFVAAQPGKFQYRCSVSCGPMHPFMSGELIVGPNVPLWRASGLLLVLLGGLLFSHWKSRSTGEVNVTTQQEAPGQA